METINKPLKQQILSATLHSNYQPLKAMELLKEEKIPPLSENIEKENPTYLTILDSSYPTSLTQLDRPPLCLFYQGNLSLMKKRLIGIIGSRNCDEYGEIVVSEIVKALDKDWVVVSGLAKGIDGLSHKYALEYGKETIGIIGSGLKYQYPLCNQSLYKQMAQKGLILSEYAYNEPIRKEHFIARNRLIAAMSDVLVVVESTLHSGTLITVNEMLTLGKEVYVVPHPLFSKCGEGNLKLLFEGANILYSIEEFVKSLKRV